MDTLRVEVGFGFFHRGVKRSGWEERLLGNYPAACGKSRHRASSVAVVRDGIGGILDVRWDIYRERPLGGLLGAVLRHLGGRLGASWGLFLGGILGPPGGLFGHKDRLSAFIPARGRLLGLSGSYKYGYIGLFWAPLRPF